MEGMDISPSLDLRPFRGRLQHTIFEKSIFWRSFDEQKIAYNYMDPSEPISKGLPFTSLKVRQLLLLWNCSNGESFFFETLGRRKRGDSII